MKFTYRHTMYACFAGCVVQAIVNNFAPLLFLTFHQTYGIPLSKITLLVTVNFGFQLAVDFLSGFFIERVGYRIPTVAAHIAAAAGLLGLVFLPDMFADPFTGLLTAVMIYAVGGGLTEVTVSPIVEACPSENKEGAMSLLHSFYCWGHVAVILISTVYFSVFGIENWRMLAVLWAVLPLANTFLFLKVPIAGLLKEGDSGLSVRELFSDRTFWLLFVLMLCAGASEQAVSQWVSAFAELGLSLNKTLGDLFGAMLFAVLMGTARSLNGRFSARLNLHGAMLASSLLCVFSYLLISFAPSPWLGLLGCGICGFSVGILWPGTFSIAAARIPRGAGAMFAYLALAGDLGCTAGPTLTGRIAGLFSDNLKAGIFCSAVFPLMMTAGVALLFLKGRRKSSECQNSSSSKI